MDFCLLPKIWAKTFVKTYLKIPAKNVLIMLKNLLLCLQLKLLEMHLKVLQKSNLKTAEIAGNLIRNKIPDNFLRPF